MAIDPTAPISPILPAKPAADPADPAKAMLALARTAIANTAATLGEMAAGTTQTESETLKTGQGATTTAASASAQGQSVAHAAAPAAPSLAERVAVAVRSAAAQAAPKQTGLAPMMANLDAAIARPETPRDVRQAAQAVLDKALPTAQSVTASALRQAVQGSGVFLEARLARAAAAPPELAAKQMAADPPMGDMKAALLVLRAVVSTWLAKSPTVAQDPRTQPAKTPAQPSEAGGKPVAAQLPRGGGYASLIQAQASGPASGAPTNTTTAATTVASPQAQEEAASAESVEAPGVAVRSTAPSAPSETAPADGPEIIEEPSAELPKSPAEPTSTAVRPVSAPPAKPFLMVGLIEEDTPDLLPPPLVGEKSALAAPKSGAYGMVRPQQTPPPPPYAGGPTSAQAPAQADLPAGLPSSEVARRLLKDVGGAIARQELSQIASLPEGHHEAERPAEAKSPRWVFDLPLQTPQGVAVAQFEISKDGGGSGGDAGREVERTWRARFSLDVEPLGPVHVQVALTGSMTRVGFWAERPDSMARLRAGEEALNAALRQAELTPEVAFHAGSPAASPTALGRFVDRET